MEFACARPQPGLSAASSVQVCRCAQACFEIISNRSGNIVTQEVRGSSLLMVRPLAHTVCTARSENMHSGGLAQLAFGGADSYHRQPGPSLCKQQVVLQQDTFAAAAAMLAYQSSCATQERAFAHAVLTDSWRVCGQGCGLWCLAGALATT